MDIGVNDLTVIVFFQIAHGEIRIIDYYEDKNKDVPFYTHFLLKDKSYIYHTIFLPHDSAKRDPLDIDNSYERDFRRLFSHTNTRILRLPKMDVQLSISHTRILLDRCVFNVTKTKPFVDNLGKYRKKWSEAQGRYLQEPQENVFEHYADAMRYVCMGVKHLEAAGTLTGSLEKHRAAVEGRAKRII